MTKTFKTILILVAVAVVTSAPLQAARVNNVHLSYQDGHTVARIDVEGTIRFTHQTEIAKDGKPYRVILDILSATHNLGAKNFLELQTNSVQHLRTSQYQVKPEKVVRLVFDMKRETPYRVESDNASVTLYFSDKSGQSFAAWSSAQAVAATNSEKAVPQKTAPMAQRPEVKVVPEKPAVTVAEKNASIEKDRQTSLAPSKPTAQTQPKQKPAASESKTKVVQGDEHYGPAFVTPAPATSKPVIAEKPTESTPANQEVASKERMPAPQSTKPMAQSTAPQTKAASQPAVTAEPKAEKPVVAAAPEKPAPATTAPAAKKEQPKAAPNKDASKAKAMAKAKAEEDQDAAKKSTARFRRNADRKIKGTVVAEFPKRLVIKYKSGGKRDPFETLINETKTVNNPIEARVPNVEGLRLVGVIEAGDGSNSALCEDKDDYGYILKAGDKVQKGYVLRVAADRVYFQIFEYGWSRTVALNLQDY